MNKERQAETAADSKQMPIDTTSSPNAAKPNVICRFSFGEWVLIDNEVSGQIVDFYGDDWWMVDVNGKWGAVDGNRLTKDNRYVSANGI